MQVVQTLDPNNSNENLAPTARLQDDDVVIQSKKQQATVRADQVLAANILWDDPGARVDCPLIDGLSNEDLWLLVRRFNNRTSHLRAIGNILPGEVDPKICNARHFDAEELRGITERLYMTIIVGQNALFKHINHLRSWTDPTRTLGFCTLYFLAWSYDALIPGFAFFLISSILSIRFRNALLPPVPIARTAVEDDSNPPPDKSVRKSDSITGVPEAHKGEAVEAEASHFVTAIARIAMATFSVPRSEAISSSMADANTRASGNYPHELHEITKTPMEERMWASLDPLMHQLSDLTDNWERLGNVLSPMPPFIDRCRGMRLIIAGAIFFVASVCYFTPFYLLSKVSTLSFGFYFFVIPLIHSKTLLSASQTLGLSQIYDTAKSLIKGIPTNAQLTIALLRLAEARKSPLPPPPRSNTPFANHSTEDPGELHTSEAGSSPLEARKAYAGDHALSTKAEAGSAEHHINDDPESLRHGKLPGKIMKALRITAKVGVKTVIAGDAVLAKAGSSGAQHRRGIVPESDDALSFGANDFVARYQGEEGHVKIDVKDAIPRITFSKRHSKLSTELGISTSSAWSMAIAEIAELQKVDGYGLKIKLTVSWALGRTVKDGLKITDIHGNERHLTALPLRDELFNRLASVGFTKWELLV